jgi:hypothetical protein
MKTYSHLFASLVLFASMSSHAQVTDMTIFQSNMRSKATNQFYQEEFRRVGSYKVKGSSLLLKGHNVTDLYSTLGYGTNLPIIFDCYTQKLSILQENGTDVIQLTNDEVDSFRVKIDKDINNSVPMLFINAEKIDPSRKMFLQQLTNEKRYNLYKHYLADMKPAAMDVAQTNVMEFKIVDEYYFLDNNEGSFVKIKPNGKSLREQFKDKKEALKTLDSALPLETRLRLFFGQVN